MPYSTDNVPKEWSASTQYKCPICATPLYQTNTKEKVQVWCANANCTSIGANEGATGKTEKDAWETFRQKMGLVR